MKNSVRTLFLTFFVVLLFLFLLTGKTFAYTDYNASRNDYQSFSKQNPLNTEDDVPQTLHSTMQVLIIETISALNCQVSGVDPSIRDHKCLGTNPITGKIGFVENGGLVSAVGSMISFTLTPPISSGQYLSYLKDNFGITKGAYANNHDQNGLQNDCKNSKRGVGFCGLAPVLPLWVAMRNVVYLIMILIFLIIGIGIMLRIHIDPRTVMTVQNQIPKIIMGILAVTFSFAIAGFLIDIMWVATYLFASVIGTATGTSTDIYTQVVRANNPFDAASKAFPGGILDISGQSSAAFAKIITEVLENILNFDSVPIIGGALTQAVNIIISGLAFFIITIAILIALFRLLITLLLSYINIIIDVIFAPFWIIAGVLPASSMSLGSWVKDMAANLAVFPVTIAFFLLANYFVRAFGEDTIANRLTPPLMGGIDNGAIAALIGLGFIMMLPNLLASLKAAFKTPKLSFGPIFGPVGSAVKYPTGIAKRTGATLTQQNELIMKENPQGPEKYTWGRKGIRKVVTGKLFS